MRACHRRQEKKLYLRKGFHENTSPETEIKMFESFLLMGFIVPIHFHHPLTHFKPIIRSSS